MTDFEKLGVFYLGRVVDPSTRQRTAEPLLYDARDLVTHAVCVGMTGSGKTGLCIDLIEEAAIDGIPALVIDPKGDLGNLLLTFPELNPSDFEPWVDPEAARRKGVTVAELAGSEAERWRAGLAEWGQDGERIRRLRAATDLTIYTPGSTAGVPISVLRSFTPPPAVVRDDPDLMQERLGTTVTSLLGLIGVEGDPVRSREHILLSTLLDRAWRAGQQLDLASLIQQVQSPPVERVGVLDLEAFFPAKDRFALASALNGLIAAPGFSAWIEGDPLDVQRLLYTSDGRPRVAIVSIAHLADAQRMFFISMLLNETLGWTRSQSGTTSLRALVYMDEILGYVPPTANPPSKLALLLMMKQARAFGVGVVLATQNPVDLDYKALSNAGTWFVGRLQTERDQLRVVEAIESAAAAAGQSLDRQDVERTLSALGSRMFLMHNVHEQGPVLFESRWAMSYLRGPLTRDQIRGLMGGRPATDTRACEPTASLPAVAAPPQTAPPAAVRSTGTPAAGPPRWVLPPEVPQFFLPAPGAASYSPMLVGAARVRYADSKTGADETRDIVVVTPFGRGAAGVDWAESADAEFSLGDLSRDMPAEAALEDLPPDAQRPRRYQEWTRSFTSWIARERKLPLFRNASLRLVSSPGENEAAFRLRIQQAAREKRDAEVDRLRSRYAPKAAALEERLRRAKTSVAREEQQASQSGVQTAISFGATLLGAVLGRKVLSGSNIGRATTAARSAGRAMKEKEDIGRAKETVAAVEARIAQLEADLAEDIAALEAAYDLRDAPLETITLTPKRGHVEVQTVALVWLPR
jgi:hypothetical protein